MSDELQLPMLEEDKKSRICRVCLSYDFQREGGKGVSLFEEYNSCVISNKINALANVGIKEGDGLPDRICPECLLELEHAFKFKEKCEKTNEVLLAAVNEAPTFDDNDDDLLNIKAEYLEDTEYEELDDNLSADLEASCFLDKEQPVAARPKPSKAIDLKLICNDCGESFKSKCKLRVHWKKVHLPEHLKCPNCLRMFKSFAAFNLHKKKNSKNCVVASKLRIEGEGKNRIFHCKECDYHSKRIHDLSYHIVIHSGERPFQCDLCLKYFTQSSSVHKHKESAHKIYKFEGTCDHCGKTFKVREKLRKHILTHSQISYPCKICKVVLKYKRSLKTHLIRHSGVKAFSCEKCSASFYTSNELWVHRTNVHIKLKQYTCEICLYTSRVNAVIKKHKMKHTPSNVGCNVCGKFVENEYQLELHQKRHTDRDYPCPHCDRTYYSRSNLSKHICSKHRFVMLNESPASNKRPAPSKSVKSELSAKS